MLIKGKNSSQDTEINFEAGIDLGFWALPVSICWISKPKLYCLSGGFDILFRILCFQFSWGIWKWDHEVIDVGNSIEELFNGQY
jgi:hypothetical protein